jgi:hypothetical protein
MHKLQVFTFSEEYKNHCITSYMLNFLRENLAPDGGLVNKFNYACKNQISPYAFNDFTKRILVNKFNCTYKNQSSPHVGLHYLEFSKEQDRTFFLLRFS